MTHTRSTAGAGGLPEEAVLRRALDAYFTVIESQGVGSLPDLDRWYQDELPEKIASREPRHLTLPEMVRLTEWKMARGVWRAPNLVLVRGNDDELVAAQLPGLGEVAWTLGYYARYADTLRDLAAGFGGDWTPARLERALWAHAGGKAGAGRK